MTATASSSSPCVFAGLGHCDRQPTAAAAAAPNGTNHRSRGRLAAEKGKSGARRLARSSAPTRALRLGLEYSNEYYPDIRHTAMVMLALGDSARHYPCVPAGLPVSAAWPGCSPCQSERTAGGRLRPTITWIPEVQVPFADHKRHAHPPAPISPCACSNQLAGCHYLSAIIEPSARRRMAW